MQHLVYFQRERAANHNIREKDVFCELTKILIEKTQKWPKIEEEKIGQNRAIIAGS